MGISAILVGEPSGGHQDTCRMGIWVVTGAVADGNVCSFAWASYSSTLLVSLTSV